MEFSYNESRIEQEFLDPLRIALPCRIGRVDLLSCNAGGSEISCVRRRQLMNILRST